jgi:hypothetical protein
LKFFSLSLSLQVLRAVIGRKNYLIDTFFADYKEIAKKPKPSANVVECDFNIKPGEGQFCQVNAKDLMTGPCTTEKEYGFPEGKPCILLKLNKVSR